MRTRWMVLALSAFLCACAGQAGPPVGAGSARGDDAITDLELSEQDANDLYTVVRNLRPQWLRTRVPPSELNGNQIVVYFGTARMGGPEALRQIPTGNAREVEYLSPSKAQFRFGNGHVNGAILVLPATQ